MIDHIDILTYFFEFPFSDSEFVDTTFPGQSPGNVVSTNSESENVQTATSKLLIRGNCHSNFQFSRHNISGAKLRKCCVVKIENLSNNFRRDQMSLACIASQFGISIAQAYFPIEQYFYNP